MEEPTMEQQHQQHYGERRGVIELWLGALVAPIAWTIQLLVVYGASSLLCEQGSVLVPVIVSVLALMFAAVGFLLAHRSWRAAGRSLASDGPGVVGRTRLFSLVGMGSSLLFLLVIVVQALPLLFLEPCVS